MKIDKNYNLEIAPLSYTADEVEDLQERGKIPPIKWNNRLGGFYYA